ncbi:MAG: hypothetical protein U0K18_03880 [Acutalibacteraceae bacterium]|nr:hypothetical protein [Acutalibacteraceae bacterium]
MTVTFFGHKDTPSSVAPELKNVLTALIEKEGATLFYVGNEGNFDRTVYDTLKELKEKYPFIEYKVVLAYLTKRKKDIKNFSFLETIYPEKLAETPLRFAISKRNSIMLNLADTVVTYVRGPGGGAADFKRLAESKGKRVINLCK